MNCPIISEPEIGGQAFSLAYSILVTIIVSGFFVTVIIESGLVEFVSFLIEPFMRKLFKIPGYAAVDCLSSFVSSASVGIYLTDGFYKEKNIRLKKLVLLRPVSRDERRIYGGINYDGRYRILIFRCFI